MLSLLISPMGTACAQEAVPVAPVKRVALTDSVAGFVAEASQRFGIPATWIQAIIRIESAGDPQARSPKGAMGLMQIMPSTWQDWRNRLGLGDDPFEPHANILAGTAFLREMHDRYGSPSFLAAYNAGPARYEDHLATGRPLPAETRAYLAMLTPMLDGKLANGVIALAHKTANLRSWMTAPMFITAEQTAASDRLSIALSAVAPHSDGLFVRVPKQERQP
jgi:hypothetical protein